MSRRSLAPVAALVAAVSLAPGATAAPGNAASPASPPSAGVATAASADPPAEAAQRRGRARIRSFAKNQQRILNRGAIRVRVRMRGGPGRVTLWSSTRTFDQPRLSRLTRANTVRLRRAGARFVRLRLTREGRRALRSCEMRTLRVVMRQRGRRTARMARLVRATAACRPKPVDVSRAADCNFIGQQEGSLCLLPFPDDHYTVAEPSAQTGRRVNLTDAGMPQNAGGTPIAAQPYNLNDGFSPGQTAVVRVPGLDTPDALARTDALSLDRLSRNDEQRPDEPIVVIDAETGERHPIWVELNAHAPSAEENVVLIRPARNYASGRRYIVAMRNLRTADGQTIPAPEGFRYHRDSLRSDAEPINEQRPRMLRIFRNLRDAGIDRADLYLAWDFTVASDIGTAQRMLHIRDDAFAELGDADLADLVVEGDAPQFSVTDVENFAPGENSRMARRVQGTFEVPCYLEPSCAPGGRFALGQNGLPSRNGTWTANFNCMVPRAAVDQPGAEPGRAQLYGHGLLGSAGEVTTLAQQILGQAHNFVLCGSDEIGFSSADVPNIANSIVPDLGNFPELTDRVQQGLLNQLFLGRLMIHPDGLVSDAAFRVDDTDPTSQPVLDTSNLYYNGNSQGGILGGALTAVAPDFTRAVLGVPAMNYSILLDRSVQFDPFRAILEPAYPNAIAQQLALTLIQMLWDRSDPSGYAHRMTTDPLPGTPSHEVLLQVAFGDHQVTQWQADVQARTIGAHAHAPVVFSGRWPGVDVLWGVPRIQSYPFAGSAIVYWDSGPVRPNPTPPPDVVGNDPPPVENLPNRSGVDPHGHPRVAPPAMQMVSEFLRPNAQSAITDTCMGPCFAGGFTGP